MTIKTIFVNQNTHDTSYFTVGSKPYPKPQIAHPILRSSLHSKNNHELVFHLDTTQQNNDALDLIVDYKLYLSPKETNPKPIQKGSIHVLEKIKDLSFSNLLENKLYQLEMQFYNPYYQDIAGVSTTQASTTNSDSFDLSHVGDQTQERDNRLTFSIVLGDHPENISIEIEDVQQKKEAECGNCGKCECSLANINFSGKPKNQELKFNITNIPPGLYHVSLKNNKAEGLLDDWKLSKYDNGVTIDQIFPGDFGLRKKILMSIGKFELKSDFIDSLSNMSNLHEAQVRRARRGKVLSTTGSFQNSSGGRAPGPCTYGMPGCPGSW